MRGLNRNLQLHLVFVRGAMGLNFWKSAALLLLQVTWIAGNENSRSAIEAGILQKMFLAKKFNVYVRPDQSLNETTDEPLQVSVSLFILNTDIDIKNQECNMLMYFRQEWNDTRLAYDDNAGKVKIVLVHEAVGFWTPDLFFVSEKLGSLHTVTKPNTFVRINPLGNIFYSQKLSVKVSCAMDLRDYPFDRQICVLPIESYGYPAHDMLLSWKPEITFGIDEIPGHRISYSTLEEVIHVGENDYSRLELHIHFERLIHAMLLHVYLPLGLLVVASWMTFWLRPSSRFPRLTAAIITTLATLTFLLSVGDHLPSQPHLTALNVWVDFSCLLIFAAVIQNIYVVAQSDLPSPAPESEGISDGKDVPAVQKAIANGGRKLTDILAGKLSVGDSNIDRIAKLAFPFIFILFNIIYLAYYLI